MQCSLDPLALAPHQDANLWDVTLAPTIVLTQRGARQRFQSALRAAGVEVVEFDFLTPESVADYCQERGFLQCFWECGGTLAAPAIASGVVHKVGGQELKGAGAVGGSGGHGGWLG